MNEWKSVKAQYFEWILLVIWLKVHCTNEKIVLILFRFPKRKWIPEVVLCYSMFSQMLTIYSCSQKLFSKFEKSSMRFELISVSLVYFIRIPEPVTKFSKVPSFFHATKRLELEIHKAFYFDPIKNKEFLSQKEMKFIIFRPIFLLQLFGAISFN